MREADPGREERGEGGGFLKTENIYTYSYTYKLLYTYTVCQEKN